MHAAGKQYLSYPSLYHPGSFRYTPEYPVRLASKYDLTYFSGENSSDFEQTLKNTIDEIQKLNKEYTPENDTD